jgi:hypothetical protein
MTTFISRRKEPTMLLFGVLALSTLVRAKHLAEAINVTLYVTLQKRNRLVPSTYPAKSPTSDAQ